MFYLSQFQRRNLSSKFNEKNGSFAHMQQVQEQLYRNMEAYMQSEERDQKVARVGSLEEVVDPTSRPDLNAFTNAENEKRAKEDRSYRMTLDHFLLDLTEEQLNDFFARNEHDLYDEKEDGTRELITEQHARDRWAYLQKLKKADPLIRRRLPDGPPVGQASRRDPQKLKEVPLKLTKEWVDSRLEGAGQGMQSESSFSSGTPAAKKFDPSILSSVKEREHVVKEALKNPTADAFKDTLEKVKQRRKAGSLLGRYIPFLKTQRNRNFAQFTAVATFGVGYMVYYMNKEEWHPKRVTKDDMSDALREIREIREQYAKQQGGVAAE